MGEGEKDAGAMRVTPDMIFDCPFCVLCTVIVGDTEDGRTIVVHSLPMCEVFLAEDPLAFLERVRKRLHETNVNLS
jgi:hypothetical protein